MTRVMIFTEPCITRGLSLVLAIVLAGLLRGFFSGGNSSLLRWKNTKEPLINHKGTRMVKDGED